MCHEGDFGVVRNGYVPRRATIVAMRRYVVRPMCSVRSRIFCHRRQICLPWKAEYLS